MPLIKLFDLDIPRENGLTICKQWRPWLDVAFCGMWPGSALFANYPFGVPRINIVKLIYQYAATN